MGSVGRTVVDSNGIARHPKSRAGSAAGTAAPGIHTGQPSVAPATDERGSAVIPSLRSELTLSLPKGQALTAPVRHRPPSAWLSLLAGSALLLGTGCSALGLSGDSSEPAIHTVDPNVPFVVVTVGGSPGATAPLSVAETIPDSTPLPRIALPTPAPNANSRTPAAAARAAPPAPSPRVP